jgi:hypothetical protein
MAVSFKSHDLDEQYKFLHSLNEKSRGRQKRQRIVFWGPTHALRRPASGVPEPPPP